MKYLGVMFVVIAMIFGVLVFTKNAVTSREANSVQVKQ